MSSKAARLLLAFMLSFAVIAVAADKSSDLAQTLGQVSAAYAKLEPQSIRPAEGFIKYDYLIPAGYYKQMWDWDGFFIGSHLAQQGKPQYLKYWVLDFAGAIDKDGYVAGCITTKGSASTDGPLRHEAIPGAGSGNRVRGPERLRMGQADLGEHAQGHHSTVSKRSSIPSTGCSSGRTRSRPALTTMSR